MPLQGSGSISISELATEFGGTAPHSLSEYYKSAGLVPNQRAITGSESYTSLVTGDQIASTGIYVNGGTDSKTCTDATFAAQTISDDGGDYYYRIATNVNESSTAETAATTITIASGTYVNITLHSMLRYYVASILGADRDYMDVYWWDSTQTGKSRRIGLDWRTTGLGGSYATGYEIMHEFTAGQSSDFTVTNSTVKDLSSVSHENYTKNTNNAGWVARPSSTSGRTSSDYEQHEVTIKGYATQATTIKIIALLDNSSTQDGEAMHMNGPATGPDPDPDSDGDYNNVEQASSLTMNQFKAYNNNSYALSVNGTSIPANTPSGSAVVFADNLLSTSVTASVTGNQPLNADVPTSGAISLTDFYSSEDE